MTMCLRSPRPEAINFVYPDPLYGLHNTPTYKWNGLKSAVVLSCGLNADLFPGLEKPGIVDSIDLLREMLNYTAENIEEEATDY